MYLKKLTEADILQLNCQKRRQLHPENSKDEMAKRRKAQGDTYVSRNGVARPGVVPPIAGKACIRCNKEGCQLPHNVKLALFDQFREKDRDEQNLILAGCIDIQEPKQQITLHSRKEHTFKYHLNHNGTRKEACRATLVNIFGVTVARLRVITKKMEDGEIAPTDKRGRHQNRPKAYNNVIKQDIRIHIHSFPTVESHYTRNHNPNALYLEPSLTLSKMYELFIEYQRGHQRQECEIWLYRHIFNTEFPNLKISKPKTDTCDRCDEYKWALVDATAFERTRLLLQQASHHTTWEEAMALYKADSARARLDSAYIVLTVDLQQIIFTPGLRNNASFYLRKLANYNLGIHRANDRNTYMHLWTEIDGKRGSNEVTSCLWKFVTSNYQVTQQQRELVVWMDRCVGQNNNKIVLSALVKLVTLGYFTKIDQKFFCSGHSYNDCDRAFGTVEKKMRKMTLLLPDDLEPMLRDACEVNPFVPVRLAQADILDFKSATARIAFPAGFFVTKHLHHSYAQNQQHIECKRDFAPTALATNYRIAFRLTFPQAIPQVLIRPRVIDQNKLHDLQKLLQFLDGAAYAFYDTLVSEQTP